MEGDFDNLPKPVDRALPRKSSFSSLRSALARKTSTGTLRSVKVPFPTNESNFNFPPHLPPRWRDGEHGDGCLPSTPRGRRTPKTSIGAPRLQPSTSPSTFLADIPRRAPGTPKKIDDLPASPPPVPELYTGDESLDSILNTPIASLQTPQADALDAARENPDAIEIISFFTPLTVKAAKQIESGVLKPKRLFDLLPRQQRINLGLQTPPSTGALRINQSTQFGEVNTAARSKMGPNGLPTPDYSPSRSIKVKAVCAATPDYSPVGRPRMEVKSNRAANLDTTGPIRGMAPVASAAPAVPAVPAAPAATAAMAAPVVTHRTSAATKRSSAKSIASPYPDTKPSHSAKVSITSHISSPSEAGTFGTFGNTPPLNIKPRVASRPCVPDFTASPERADRSFASEADISGIGTFRSSTFSTSSVSTEGLDGWKRQFEAGMGREWQSQFDGDVHIPGALGIGMSSVPGGLDQVGEMGEESESCHGDAATEDSHVPTEEWELEAYLRQFESVDGHSVKSGKSVRSGWSGQVQGYQGIC